MKASATANSGAVLTDQAMVIIRVRRNENGPLFIEDYSAEIPETMLIGTSILTVEATDADGVSPP